MYYYIVDNYNNIKNKNIVEVGISDIEISKFLVDNSKNVDNFYLIDFLDEFCNISKNIFKDYKNVHIYNELLYKFKDIYLGICQNKIHFNDFLLDEDIEYKNRYKYFDKIIKKTNTLDNILDNIDNLFILLTTGYDYNILLGAKNILKNINFLGINFTNKNDLFTIIEFLYKFKFKYYRIVGYNLLCIR
jgi:hypothetical protein